MCNFLLQHLFMIEFILLVQANRDPSSAKRGRAKAND